jgi:drug/metabolite transporter (DMT)-like permease
MKSACSGDVRPTAPPARHRSVAHPTPRRRVRGASALALAGILYGASTEPLAWVMSGGVDAEAFLSIRFAFAAAALLLFCRGPVADPVALLKAGVGCGLALAGSYLCLVHGLPATGGTTAGVLVSGFGIWATGIDALVRRRRPSRRTVAAIVVAGTGLLLLCGSGAGLAAVLAASVLLAVHLLLLASAAAHVDALHLIALQSVVVALVCAGPGMAAGTSGMDTADWLLAAALGIGVSGGAYLLQALGQSVVPATTAGLLLMTEPLSVVLVGWTVGDRPGPVGGVGLGLIVVAILLAVRTPADPVPDGDASARPAPSGRRLPPDAVLGRDETECLWPGTTSARAVPVVDRDRVERGVAVPAVRPVVARPVGGAPATGDVEQVQVVGHDSRVGVGTDETGPR